MTQFKQFPRRILLCAVGLTPQVVTETLFALRNAKEGFPTELHIITTKRGIAPCTDTLLGKNSALKHLCEDYGLPIPVFSPQHIHVLEDRYHSPIEEIRTCDESEDAATIVLSIVRDFCEDPISSLHVSIAGGRKNLSFLLGYAISIFGRPQDRLSHVLVNEFFENVPGFYYPSRSSAYITARDGTLLNRKDATVTLARIPIFRLRNLVRKKLLSEPLSYGRTIEKVQNAIDNTHHLRFDHKTRTVVCDEIRIKLSAVLYACYFWFVQEFVRERQPIRPSLREHKERFIKTLSMIVPLESLTTKNVIHALKNDEDFLPYFQEKRSLINKKLTLALGYRAEAFKILSTRTRPQNGYYLSKECVIHQSDKPSMIAND